MKSIVGFMLLVALPFGAIAGNPQCDGTGNWATSMAFVHLKNAGLIHNDTTDFSKTKTVRIASEKIGKDLYRQAHDVTFTEKSGNVIEVITVNDASHQECSMGSTPLTRTLPRRPIIGKKECHVQAKKV